MSKEGKVPFKTQAKEVAKEWWQAMGSVEADLIPSGSKPRSQKPSTSKEAKKAQPAVVEPMDQEEVNELLKPDGSEPSVDPVDPENPVAAEAAKMALLENGELGPLTEEQERELAEKNRQEDSDDDEEEVGAGPGPSTKEGKGSKTYSKAAKKPKLDQDLILYIQLGREKRDILPKAVWEAFADGLTKALLSMDPKLVATLNIEWMDYHLGRGIIACSDLKTTAWLKGLAEAFNHEGSTVRAWSRNEFGIRTIFQGFLHYKRWWTMTGPQALKWILEINELDKLGKFSVLTYSKKPKGVWIRFEAEEAIIAGIDAKNRKLKAGWCNLHLEKKVNDLSLKGDEDPDDDKNTGKKGSSGN